MTIEYNKDLIAILNTMDVPVFRKNVAQLKNLRWLLRNLAVRNCGHSGFNRAMDLVAYLVKEFEKKEPKSCDQCEPLMIQGVFCHETGCPNARKDKLIADAAEAENYFTQEELENG